MPYICKEDRKYYYKSVHKVPVEAMSIGDLNYFLTSVAMRWLGKQRFNYETLALIVGMLSTMKSEFVRRVLNPFEDKKIKENGDVF